MQWVLLGHNNKTGPLTEMDLETIILYINTYVESKNDIDDLICKAERDPEVKNKTRTTGEGRGGMH